MNEAEKAVISEIDKMQPEIIGLLQELISYPSENTPPTGNEGPVQAFIAERFNLLGLGVDCFRPDSVPNIQKHPQWLPGRNYTNRPNVVGVYQGREEGRSLVILTHSDVELTGNPKLWHSNPWQGKIHNGEIIGRGAGDDKGGICLGLAALAALKKCGIKLNGKLIFASVVDEEQGGGNGTLACLLNGYTAEAGLYLDGINLRGELANLGGGNIIVSIRQKNEYRAVPETLGYIASICSEIIAFGEQRYKEIITYPGYEDNTAASRGIQIASIAVGDSMGELSRGGEINCWGYALPDEESSTEMLQAMKNYLDRIPNIGNNPYFSYELGWHGRFLLPSRINAEEDIVHCLAGAYQAATGKNIELGSAEMSDQPLMNRYGAYPTVGFGIARWLGKGAAHTPDEAVSIEDELIPACKVVALTLMRWCGYSYDPGGRYKCQ